MFHYSGVAANINTELQKIHDRFNLISKLVQTLTKTKRRKLISLLIAGFMLAIVPTLLQPATIQAQTAAPQVAISPTAPELGDTISVMINLPQNPGQSPYVLFKQKQYPAFAIAPNRWRALLPTTPLDRPGNQQVQVVTPFGTQAYNIALRNRDYPTQSIWLSDSKKFDRRY
jgi:uncharacterized membrane protein